MKPFSGHQLPDLFTRLDRCSEALYVIYERAIRDYHVHDAIDTPVCNPYPGEQIEQALYWKCWIDTVQWHVEDEIRRPEITAEAALLLKRRIDRLNQERTDQVELIDHFLLLRFKNVLSHPSARVNTESPAWAMDRLSILALKIYHMEAETCRMDAPEAHILKCREKLAVLYEQRTDIICSINELLQDIAAGRKYMKVYKQMKMYNDPTLNPVLYGKTGH